MFKVSAPGKKIKDTCLELGKPYTINVIDAENVIYRNLNDVYDFEVSGLDNRRKSFNATIYVWQLKNGRRIVETISGIESLTDLKAILEATTNKYLDLIKLL